MSKAEVSEAQNVAGLSTGGLYMVGTFQGLRYLTPVHTGEIQSCLLLLATLVSDRRVPKIEARAILMRSSGSDTATHSPKSQTQIFLM